jgi:hypothetical protein
VDLELFRGIQDESLVLRFGAEAGEDIDLLVVSRWCPYHQQIRLGRLDLTILPERTAVELAQLQDLLLTTPLQAGRLIAGSPETHSQLLAASRRGAPLGVVQPRGRCSDRSPNDLPRHSLRRARDLLDGP